MLVLSNASGTKWRLRTVADIGAREFVCGKSGESRSDYDDPVAFGPVRSAARTAVEVDDRRQVGDRVCTKPFRECLCSLGPADERHRVRCGEVTCVEKVAQGVPVRPAPPDRRGFVGVCVSGESV
jgi:hypothetical protein